MAKTLCSINPPLHVGARINHSRPLLKCRSQGGGLRRVVVNMSLSHHHQHNHDKHHINQPYWAAINDQIQAHLKKVVTVKDPVSVFEPMHHLVFSSPLDTAPALCVAACDLVGGGGGCGGDQALAAAAALQIIHAAYNTHEYLPLSDRPSLMPKASPGPMGHHAFGPNVELLTGDGMVPFGLELVAKSDDPAQNSSKRILRVIVEITRAIGSLGVVDGQYSELQCSQLDGNGSWHVELINNTCEKKEGGLHACAAACGAILGGGSEEEIERLRMFGLYVGMIRGTLLRYSPEKRSIRVEELRDLALKELEGFDGANVKAISSFIEGNLSHV
ncbi:hypothetical protein Ddye_027517 [Dipteronia dyeriana]|uniref:Uncharacterized protein n=1 Tax=Dipteronia dyeriana TaxID=168575 RepID=A0AAD9WRH4_9ROSI|nr:hypothetical protein Ddye_027517 [Dipteronia dyeriana]